MNKHIGIEYDEVSKLFAVKMGKKLLGKFKDVDLAMAAYDTEAERLFGSPLLNKKKVVKEEVKAKKGRK